ncbi:MAG TPA: hypothetical protein VFG69_11970 [Nannocystaceae bacterium]|nr:hypothetical protein [Nannocystaceae bacterium]
MLRTRDVVLVSLVVLSASACSLPGSNLLDPPDVPDDYPQLGQLEDGRAQLVVDGEAITTKDGGGTAYDPGGLDPETLPASVDFDYVLSLRFSAPDEGTYESAAGELTASWSGDDADFRIDDDCGTGTMVVAGQGREHNVLDRLVIWGTLQLELCEYDSEGPLADRIEISGRFTSIVTEI